MKPGQIALVAVAVLAMIGSAILVIAQLQPEPPPRDPIAVWVCDHCGTDARAPLGNRSPDCTHCSEGQMVQRVYFRCPACAAVFEAYHVNWSPKADRAADSRKEADAHVTLAAECENDPLLVRPPDGTWQWLDCLDGAGLFHHLECPKCHRKGRRHEFGRLLDPTAP